MISPARQPKLLIDFHNVVVVRENKTVFDGLSLQIPAGENVAIIGPNGSGKSTLLKLISQELHPLLRNGSYGRILGRDRWELFELRNHLGIVANDLLAGSSRPLLSRDVVLSGFFGSAGIWPHHVITPEMEEKTDAALAKVGAAHVAERYWTEISSGEARRVMLARALVHGPQALVLDEPSNSLDLAAYRDLRATLRSLAQSGTSLILVTHHLFEIIPEITRIVLLKEGKVFRHGTRDEVLRREVISELFGVQLSETELKAFLQLW